MYTTGTTLTVAHAYGPHRLIIMSRVPNPSEPSELPAQQRPMLGAAGRKHQCSKQQHPVRRCDYACKGPQTHRELHSTSLPEFQLTGFAVSALMESRYTYACMLFEK